MTNMVDIFKDISVKVGNRLGVETGLGRNVPVNYLFGDWPYRSKAMETISKSRFTERDRYPLLALFTPFKEVRDDPDTYCTVSVDILLATRTLSDYSNEQRLEISYKGLLYPLYDILIDEISKDRRFDTGSRSFVSHTKSDNMRYGSRGVYGSDGKTPFKDLFDGIDISGMELIIKNKTCR